MEIDKKRLIKYIANSVLISIILGTSIFILIEKYQENELQKNIYESQRLYQKEKNNEIESKQSQEEKTNEVQAKQEQEKEKQEEQKNEVTTLEKETNVEQVKENLELIIPDTYKGYDVCAKLEIPTISLETYVLKNYSTNALKISVTKFWGADPNQIGNFCIAGHNFINKNMFSNLKKLKSGDTLFVTDSNGDKVEYRVFLINQVNPKDVSCLDPVTQNEREVTLITCTNDSKKRVIIKAREMEQ